MLEQIILCTCNPWADLQIINGNPYMYFEIHMIFKCIKYLNGIYLKYLVYLKMIMEEIHRKLAILTYIYE